MWSYKLKGDKDTQSKQNKPKNDQHGLH